MSEGVFPHVFVMYIALGLLETYLNQVSLKGASSTSEYSVGT